MVVLEQERWPSCSLGAGLQPKGGRPTSSSSRRTLAAEREKFYRHRKVDIVKTGFRPVGGKVADFAVASLNGRFHFFYIERRLQEATPFYPGHEIFFGHASTPDFIEWEVHDPVMLVRPDSWEEAHVWAPCIIRRGTEFVMVYTGGEPASVAESRIRIEPRPVRVGKR